MLVEGFSQALRDHSQTIKVSCFSLFYFFILHLLVKNRYEIVHISHEINDNKKSYLTSFFPVKAVTFALKRETQNQCERSYLFEN